MEGRGKGTGWWRCSWRLLTPKGSGARTAGCWRAGPRSGSACRSRDLSCAGRQVRAVWVKRRWYCPTASCGWVTFTESLPGLAPHGRLTGRLREGLTGASNAGSEGVNQVQKLDLRASFGYRNPENQRRRARVATLRSARRLHHTGTHRHRLWVPAPTTIPVKDAPRSRSQKCCHGGSSNGSLSSANMPHGAPPADYPAPTNP